MLKYFVTEQFATFLIDKSKLINAANITWSYPYQLITGLGKLRSFCCIWPMRLELVPVQQGL